MACRIHAAAASCTAAATTASSSASATGCVRCSGTGNSAGLSSNVTVAPSTTGFASRSRLLLLLLLRRLLLLLLLLLVLALAAALHFRFCRQVVVGPGIRFSLQRCPGMSCLLLHYNRPTFGARVHTVWCGMEEYVFKVCLTMPIRCFVLCYFPRVEIVSC